MDLKAGKLNICKELNFEKALYDISNMPHYTPKILCAIIWESYNFSFGASYKTLVVAFTTDRHTDYRPKLISRPITKFYFTQ